MQGFQGLSAFPITPSDEQGRVDTAALQTLLTRLVAARVDSIGLLGSTGSYPYFTRDERRRAIEAAVECVGPDVPLLVGIGALRTEDAIALAQDARRAGAAAGLLAPVSYLPLLDDEVFEHFRAVTAACDLPLCIYNNPTTTHFSFGPGLIARLAALPLVRAVKNPAGPDVAPLLAELRPLVPAGFSLGFSVDLNAAAALLAGGDAWYSVLGGTFPNTARRLLHAARSGDAAEAARQHAALQPLWGLFTRHTSYRVVHAAAALSGIPHARPTRPVLPLTGAAEAEVRATLERLALD